MGAVKRALLVYLPPLLLNHGAHTALVIPEASAHKSCKKQFPVLPFIVLGISFFLSPVRISLSFF